MHCGPFLLSLLVGRGVFRNLPLTQMTVQCIIDYTLLCQNVLFLSHIKSTERLEHLSSIMSHRAKVQIWDSAITSRKGLFEN